MNQPYDSARVRMLSNQFNWKALSLVLTAWGGPPTFVPTHTLISSLNTVQGVIELGHSLQVLNKAVSTNGTAQTDNILIPNVPVGNNITFFTMAESAANYVSSKLLFYVDDALYLPFVPNGLDVAVTPDWLQGRGWFRP